MKQMNASTKPHVGAAPHHKNVGKKVDVHKRFAVYDLASTGDILIGTSSQRSSRSDVGAV